MREDFLAVFDRERSDFIAAVDRRLGFIAADAVAANPVDVTMTGVGFSMPVSTDTAMDYGLIPDTRPPFVPTRRQRFRWWRQARLSRARMRLASWLAGFDVEDRA